ncbi:unnamed protein product [Rotaria magnacalcarata]|uniref:Uncharacterized protein n=1 Tax=Rotaria magnacalcarata TaxID=392030 RepID=A0A816VK75_9BILA|nr:unnamed protein product [Rotaria magnacalcarata]
MSKENLVEFVASIIDEPSSEAISIANANGDYNQSIRPSTPLPNISSGELEVNDIVVVASLNNKLSDHDSIAEELITVTDELLIFGRTRTERDKFIQEMERILLGDNIKTKQGFHMALNYALNKTINMTFEMIIISLIDHVKNAFDIDSNAAVDDLAEFVAQACFFGKTVDIFYNMNIDDHSQNMKVFLRKCVAELATFMENQTEVEHEFILRYFKLSSKIILNQLL